MFIGIWNDFVFAAVVGGRETHTLPRYLGESVSPQFNVLAARIVLTVAPCIALVALLRDRGSSALGLTASPDIPGCAVITTQRRRPGHGPTPQPAPR